MSPLRVALVTPRFPPDVGGLENYVGQVAEQLRDEPGTEVVVVTTGTGRRRTTERWRGVDVVRLGTWVTWSNTPLNPAWVWQLRRLLHRLRVDVVNAHAPVPGLADLAVLTGPVPVVTTYHAGSMVKGSSPVDPLLRAYERAVLPRVFRRSAGLVAVSPVSLAHATGRAVLVPPGVDTEVFVPDAATPRGPRALYVGRVERTSRWKGLDVLLRALPVLLEAQPGAGLDVVGDGDDVPRLQELARDLGVADRVAWHGAVAHADLPPHYRRAGVVVLPSTTEAESFGMTLVEAGACGAPVVGSAVGGIPHVVRDGVDGLLVPPGDAVALGAALARVLGDVDLAARLGAAGRRAAVERWDWRHQRARTLAELRRAAGAPDR